MGPYEGHSQGGAFAHKPYYLILRKDRLTKDGKGKLRPTYYCRWFDEAGRPHLESTVETSRTRAEL